MRNHPLFIKQSLENIPEEVCQVLLLRHFRFSAIVLRFKSLTRHFVNFWGRKKESNSLMVNMFEVDIKTE